MSFCIITHYLFTFTTYFIDFIQLFDYNITFHSFYQNKQALKIENIQTIAQLHSFYTKINTKYYKMNKIYMPKLNDKPL